MKTANPATSEPAGTVTTPARSYTRKPRPIQLEKLVPTDLPGTGIERWEKVAHPVNGIGSFDYETTEEAREYAKTHGPGTYRVVQVCAKFAVEEQQVKTTTVKDLD